MLKVNYVESTICFKSLFLLHPGPIDSKISRKHQGDVDKKIASLKSVRLEIQDGCHGGPLKNLFFVSSPEHNSQLA